MKTILKSIGLLFAVAAFYSCNKYLDAKPDKSLEIPSTLKDFQALMDDNNINKLMPYAADIGSDDYFVSYDNWSGFSADAAQDYVWGAEAANDQDWQFAYTYQLNCDVVLEGLSKIPVNAGNRQTIDNISGQAYFIRGYLLNQLATCFTLPYNKATAATDAGLTLKLKPDITEKLTRATLEQTYDQIISDLKHGAALLPVTPLVKTRPSKPAAYAALARVYLSMQDYANANLYADSSLQLYHKLIDYNTLDTSATNPFVIFNDEVVFHANSSGFYDVVDPYYARVDTTLYASYAPGDLRKPLFYRAAGDGYFAFKGDYLGQSYGACFSGVATDEVYLVRSETFARLGKPDKAIGDLNTLLATRYANGTFAPYSEAMTADQALSLVLTERRKELAFRSALRWSDLKRLNQDSRFAKTLFRQLNGLTYSLLPGDKRYAFLIPVSVVQAERIAQNAR